MFSMRFAKNDYFSVGYIQYSTIYNYTCMLCSLLYKNMDCKGIGLSYMHEVHVQYKAILLRFNTHTIFSYSFISKI